MKASRRRFAKSLAVAPLAALAQQQTEDKPVSQFGKALAEMVRANYGEHLTAAELEKIGKDFQEYAPFVEELRKFKLTNADEPDFTFQALTERW